MLSQSLAFTLDRQDGDAMLAGVADDLRRGIEAHRLAVQQGAGEDRRVVALHPGRGIDQVGEAGGVALGEAVAAEALDLLEHPLGEGRARSRAGPCPRPAAPGGG